MKFLWVNILLPSRFKNFNVAYKTYTTEALVCGSKDSYTSDRSYLLLTEAAGMLWANARSVREEKSRQRYALQDFSLVRVSLVKGKSGWRIGSVESQSNVFMGAASREARGAITRVVKLLRQFMQGEEPEPAVFADTKQSLAYLDQIAPEDCPILADIFTLRLLNRLGYIAKDSSYSNYLDDPIWQHPQKPPKTAYKAIEQAVTVSHL